ncbi:DUF6457 domain-containing protein [Actinophytocola sp.]|uniref:DUF6457 domain-containing protein n=1 Tax=Actinophytocola sp. TaxID=1872138 RepID=UPI002ED3A327
MDGLADWTSSASALLALDIEQADIAEILELARNVKRAVTNPAAIVAVYLLGVAVGRGADPREAAARLADLTDRWSGATCDWRD